MDLIKTGIGLSKTIRNVSRLKEIVVVFAKHGFDEFISIGITSKIPNFVLPKSRKSLKEEFSGREEKDWPGVIGLRLRLVFEELGPSFVKFGQLLSSREDLFDPSFIDEMKHLRDKVRPVPFETIKSSLEESLGRPIEEAFTSFDPNPIGTASIGIVFKAVLKSGEDVVVKVKRPNIDRVISVDFSILKFLAIQVEKISDEVRFLGLSKVVNDFGASLQNELNFNIEALSANRFRENLVAHDKESLLYVPKIYEDLTSMDVLVMERLKGIPFSDINALKPFFDDLTPKMNTGLKIFMKTFLNDGFFHADLHCGNFFYLENKKIGIIDFGLMGTLGRKSRQNFVAITYALITFDYENIVYEFLDVAGYEKIPDMDDLINDVRDTLSPYIGLTAQQIDFSIVMQKILGTLRKHELYLPREWFIVFRSLMALDGVGRSLGQDFDLYKIIESDIDVILKGVLNKEDLIEDAIWGGRDVLSMMRVIPRHARWFMKKWSKNDYAFEMKLTGYEKLLENINASVVFLGASLLTGVFTICGVFVLGDKRVVAWSDIPLISYIFWFIGLVAFVLGLVQLKKRDRKNVYK